MSDASETNTPNGLPDQRASSHPARTITVDNFPRPVGKKTAYDILYFFIDLKPPNAAEGTESVQKVCRLCV